MLVLVRLSVQNLLQWLLHASILGPRPFNRLFNCPGSCAEESRMKHSKSHLVRAPPAQATQCTHHCDYVKRRLSGRTEESRRVVNKDGVKREKSRTWSSAEFKSEWTSSLPTASRRRSAIFSLQASPRRLISPVPRQDPGNTSPANRTVSAARASIADDTELPSKLGGIGVSWLS